MGHVSHDSDQKIFFSGVDHMETGHFWDRSNSYQTKDGRKLSFSSIKPDDFIETCGNIARERAREVGVDILRLEARETTLVGYNLIDFGEAIEISSNKTL